MPDKNTADLGFEKRIWDAACVLRGNIDASEYKSVVLGLIFLKYIPTGSMKSMISLKRKAKALRRT